MQATRYFVQLLIYAGFAALLGYFASAPRYTHFPEDRALIKLAFAHGGQPRGECRRLSREELMQLAPNMRKPLVCPRERWPVEVELMLDGELVYAAALPPSGLSGDGPSRAYEQISVPPGRHTIALRLRDSGRTSGFDYAHEETVELSSRRSLIVDFSPAAGGFVFH